MSQWSDWSIGCILIGAELYQAISQGKLNKEAAVDKIKCLTSEFTIEEVNGLISKINSMVYNERGKRD